jgi:hypothetical protein
MIIGIYVIRTLRRQSIGCYEKIHPPIITPINKRVEIVHIMRVVDDKTDTTDRHLSLIWWPKISESMCIIKSQTVNFMRRRYEIVSAVSSRIWSTT